MPDRSVQHSKKRNETKFKSFLFNENCTYSSHINVSSLLRARFLPGKNKKKRCASQIRDDSFHTSSSSPAASSTYSEANWIAVFSMHPGISSRSSCSAVGLEQGIRRVHRMLDAWQCVQHGSNESWSFRSHDQHPVRHWFERRALTDRYGRSLRAEERWSERNGLIENGVGHSIWKDTLISRKTAERPSQQGEWRGNLPS